MRKAIIHDSKQHVVGTIEEEEDGYRVWWRNRNGTIAGNAHTASPRRHATMALAHQEVFSEGEKEGLNFMVLENGVE